MVTVVVVAITRQLKVFNTERMRDSLSGLGIRLTLRPVKNGK